MELLEGIETRRSFRAFKKTAVPREIIDRILRAASNSPSFCNTQPWEVAVVCGKKVEALSKALCKLVESDNAPTPDLPFPKNWPSQLERRLQEHHTQRSKVLGIERADDREKKKTRLLNFHFYGAPCVLFLFLERSLSPWSIFDMGLFAENIILAAHSFGLGSCLQALLASYPDTIRSFFEMPKTKQLVLGISIGYPNIEARINAYKSVKISHDDFTHWYI